MPTQSDLNKGAQGGVNPKGRGPAQPQDVEDPHPSEEEGYSEHERPGGAPAKQRREPHTEGMRRP